MHLTAMNAGSAKSPKPNRHMSIEWQGVANHSFEAGTARASSMQTLNRLPNRLNAWIVATGPK